MDIRLRICFLCGCLEPGKDGVGDYTRRLAGALSRQGHSVNIISLNDFFVTTTTRQVQMEGPTAIDVIRLADQQRWEDRFALAEGLIRELNPDWLSLQYVLFSFHPKGLPFRLARGLKQLAGGRKWHIMFHELWVGIADNAGTKLKLWRIIQRQIVLGTIRLLKPRSIHTQADLYLRILQDERQAARQLPLFSNIPFTAVEAGPQQPEALRFAIFGYIHPHSLIEPFAAELSRFAGKSGRPVQMIFLGINGKEKNAWVAACEKNQIGYTVLNEQPEDKISAVLYGADWGITSNPVLLAQKSGTVAAMKEHGLPVLSVAGDWFIRKYDQLRNQIEGVYPYVPGGLDHLLAAKTGRHAPDREALVTIANRFVQDLAATR